MDLVGSSTSHGINDSARRPSVLRWSVLGNDRKLLNGVDPEADTENTGRATAGVIIDVDPIQLKAGLFGPGTSYGHHRSPASVSPRVAQRGRILCPNDRHFRL